MNVAIGSTALVLGLIGCVAGVVVGVASATRDRPELSVRWMQPISVFVTLSATLAIVALQTALLKNDTSVAYVAEHGSSRTPFPFDVATMWSALEGSILLWGAMLCLLTALVAHRFRTSLGDPLVMWAMVVMFVVTAFFFVLMLGPARVFSSFDAPPGFDGPGPNPLLQNHVLVAFHPPMLYLGYVGFTVPFAFAVAALITGRVGEGWLAVTRRWTLFAWGFLTAGIILGAWWSYEVSGWGGYWAWDPIENASLLPWLTATAFLHSVMVQERRGMLRVWNLSLVCATFLLTILGTFLARSGVIASVHAFSAGSVGPTLLGFFAVVTLLCVVLIGWRGDALRSPGAIDSPLSREAAFLANNLAFAAFAFVVLLGTVFPIVVEAVNGDRIAVGAPFFDRMTMPLGFVLLFLMAVAPVLPWRAANAELLGARLWWPAWTSIAALGIALALGARGVAPLVAIWLGGLGLGSAGRQLVLATRRNGWRGLVGRANGGMIVHIGVIIVAVAFASSQAYVQQGEFILEPGESAIVDGHTFTYEGSISVEVPNTERPNRTEVRAQVRLDGGDLLEPKTNHYFATGQAVARPSVRVGWTSDLYTNVTKEATPTDPSVKMRIVVQPLIVWLWIGGAVILVGTALSAFPGRRRNPLDPVSTPVVADATTDDPVEPEVTS